MINDYYADNVTGVSDSNEHVAYYADNVIKVSENSDP